jgi:hypothetical protein
MSVRRRHRLQYTQDAIWVDLARRQLLRSQPKRPLSVRITFQRRPYRWPVGLRSAVHVRPSLLRDSSLPPRLPDRLLTHHRRLLGVVYTASKSCYVFDRRTSVRRTPSNSQSSESNTSGAIEDRKSDTPGAPPERTPALIDRRDGRKRL